MNAPETADALAIRCSDWARAEEVDAGGTAGSYEGFLLVEWPLPWPRDAGDAPALATVAAAARERNFRLQLVNNATGEAHDGAAESLVASYRWDGTAFPGREATVPRNDAPAAALELLADPSAGSPSGLSDVLVCGHGRRDRCCGSRGTLLALEYASRGTPAGIRVWRTSHTGGHRFAPTAALLPSGTMWANLDASLLDGIVKRCLEPEIAAGHYRGCAGLPSRAAQVVERAAFVEVGWGLFDAERHVERASDGSVRLRVGTGGHSRHFEGAVVVRRSLPVPDCGSPISESRKTEEELGISHFAEVS